MWAIVLGSFLLERWEAWKKMCFFSYNIACSQGLVFSSDAGNHHYSRTVGVADLDDLKVYQKPPNNWGNKLNIIRFTWNI